MKQSSHDNSNTGVVIPLYNYPDGTWNTIAQAKLAHPSVPIIAIVNCCSGPGSSPPSSAWVTGVRNLQSAGVTVLGYVDTAYAADSIQSVEAQVVSWHNWYGVNGIMFDEVSNVPGFESYYSTLNSYVKSLGMTYTMGNPGAVIPTSYIGALDNMCIYERAGLPNLSAIASWYPGYGKRNFSMVAFEVNQPDQDYLGAISEHLMYIFMTDGTLPNPYGAVPPYLPSLISVLDRPSPYRGRPNNDVKRRHFVGRLASYIRRALLQHG